MTTDDLLSFKRDVILALFANNDLMQQLVLKGGNLLDVVYGISTRPSRDIDFSICGEIDDLEGFRRTIETALCNWFEPKGYTIFDVNIREEPRNITADFRDFWGGYKVDFKIIDTETYRKLAADQDTLRVRAIPVVNDQGKKFPIEISKYEYVDEKVAVYVDDFTVFVYSPEMLIAEKLRAICQQMPEYTSLLMKHTTLRGRDFFDIHTVSEHFHVDFSQSSFRRTIERVFQAKRVDLKLLAKIADETTREYHRPDYISIVATVHPGVKLETFDFYFDYVVEKCNKILESFGNV
jgi:predicted nucleotidyltransferase component of viral defense system